MKHTHRSLALLVAALTLAACTPTPVPAPSDEFPDSTQAEQAPSPDPIDQSDVPAEVVQKEKDIAAAADPKLAGKPAEMLEKILAGKINRFFSEVCLENQPWVKDDKSSLKKLKPSVKVKRFVRWAIGEEL